MYHLIYFWHSLCHYRKRYIMSGIMLSILGGKGVAGPVNLTISANTTNYNIKTAVGGAYVSGSTTVNLTINSGIYVRSTSTATYALNTGTGWAAGDVINIINNGYIAGQGGNGGAGSGGNGSAGGPAIQLNHPVSITNASGFIYSGGGGGGGGPSSDNGNPGGEGGGGAGQGFDAGVGQVGSPGSGGGAGGSGGAINVVGGMGGPATSNVGGGGGGGGGGGKSGGRGGNSAGGSGAGTGGGTSLAIQRNGNTCTFVSGSARVYGGIS